MWLTDAKRAGLRFYVSSETIGTVSFATSTWFAGEDERFYFGKGAFYTAAKKRPFWLWMRYFSWRTRGSKQLSRKQKMYWMNQGRDGYRKMKGHESFREQV